MFAWLNFLSFELWFGKRKVNSPASNFFLGHFSLTTIFTGKQILNEHSSTLGKWFQMWLILLFKMKTEMDLWLKFFFFFVIKVYSLSLYIFSFSFSQYMDLWFKHSAWLLQQFISHSHIMFITIFIYSN